MTTLRPFEQTGNQFPSKLKFLALSVVATGLMPILVINPASAATTNSDIISTDSSASAQQISADDYMKCTYLKLASARLACYDRVSMGEEVTVGREKIPLDLAESVKASFSDFRPRAVFAAESNQDLQTSTLSVVTVGASTEDGDEELAKAGITIDDIAPYTPLSLAYDLDKNSENGIWTVRPHKPIYLLPTYVQYDPNRHPETPTQHPETDDLEDYKSKYDDNLELKAQISLKTKILEDVFDTNADVWFGYTQQMHWQVYNEDNSRPFRATDYMPEFFITQPVKADLPFGGRLRMLGAGAIHHSNGQSDPWSRSWNRIYLMGGAEWGKFSLVPKIWTHIKNDSDGSPSDNSDITDYYGHGELLGLYDFGEGESLSATGRYNLEEGKGAIEIDYTLPLTRDLYGFIQLFHGYGESIIDYNEKTTAVGVGLSLSDWKGL